jgi:proteasome lid subunit RPN8/RPN11
VSGGDALRLAAGVRDHLVAHARDEAPNECCGLLIGAGSAVDECVRARNLQPTPSRYHLDPAVHIATNRRLRGSGRTVLGVYHSHPRSPAVPSASDVAEALYPEFVWVIVSLARADAAEVAAFRIERGKARPIPIVG